MTDVKKDLQINFESLLKQGLGVVDVRFREYDITQEKFKFIVVHIERDRDDFYLNMILHYLGKKIKEKNIYDLWTKILNHKLEMSSMLNRDISIKVAALDFIETKKEW